MRQSTLEKKIKEGKTQPKHIPLEDTGTKVQFISMGGDENYISYLRFEDEYGRYLGSLDGISHRKKLRQLQRWVDKCLKETE